MATEVNREIVGSICLANKQGNHFREKEKLAENDKVGETVPSTVNITDCTKDLEFML